MCICHPHSQGVLLTHFGSCLEAADSETQIRCHHISTLASRGQSQPICTHPWNDIFGIAHVAICPEIPFEAVLICKSEGHVLCICHPHSQGVLLTHFGSCLEAADSETQFRRHHISTLAPRYQSQPICTHPWNDIFGIVHVATYPAIPFEAVLI